MNDIVNWIISIVALILMGIFATFFIVLNYIKELLEKGNDDDKT